MQESQPTAATKSPAEGRAEPAPSGPHSGLGRRAQRSGAALAQAAAPTKGGAGAKQGEGAGNCCGWLAKNNLNRLIGAVQRPGADQPRCGGEAHRCEGLAVECGAADDWIAGSIGSRDPKSRRKAL